jgi:methionyl-tRNA formyltransferase
MRFVYPTVFYAKISNMEDRIVFMGSPDFSVPILKSLAKYFNVVGVVTQPDRPAGRGRAVTPPPVKVTAQNFDLPVIQPRSIRKDKHAVEVIQTWKPAVIVVTAFGQILQKNLLDLPTFGCINVHASLLPRWRGVSPIQAAILNGDEITGITIMKMDEGIDTGDIISQRPIEISPDETAGSLLKKLAHIGADLLVNTLPKYLKGEITPTPQRESNAHYAAKLSKSDGELNFEMPAEYLARMVRAFDPWPGTFTYWKNQLLKIIQAHAVMEKSPGIGIVTTYEDFPAIGTGKGLLVIDEIQPSGKKTMQGDDFLRGARDWGTDSRRVN